MKNSINEYVSFPGAEQLFRIVRERITKKTGKVSFERACCIPFPGPDGTSAEQVPKDNLRHWKVGMVRNIADLYCDEAGAESVKAMARKISSDCGRS